MLEVSLLVAEEVQEPPVVVEEEDWVSEQHSDLKLEET